MTGSNGFHANYFVHDEYVDWARKYGKATYQPPLIAERDEQGVYAITTVQRKARSWRTDNQTPQEKTLLEKEVKEATERFFLRQQIRSKKKGPPH